MFTSFVLPAIITAAAVLIGGAVNAGVQYKANQDNIDATKKANQTNIDLANTSIQRKVDDAVKAGLSPLAVINGPSTSSVVTQPTHNPGIDLSSMMSQLTNVGTAVQSNLASKYMSDNNLQGTRFSSNKLANSAKYKTDKDFEIATRKLEQELLISNKEIGFKYTQLKKLYNIQKKELNIKNKDLLRQMNQTTGDLLFKAGQLKNMTDSNKLELKRLMLENRKVSKDLEKHYSNLDQKKYDTNMKTLTSIFGDLTRLLGSVMF